MSDQSFSWRGRRGSEVTAGAVMLAAGAAWIAFWGYIGLFIGLGWGTVDVFGPPYELQLSGHLWALVLYGVIASLGFVPLTVGVGFVLGFEPAIMLRLRPMLEKAWSLRLLIGIVALGLCVLAIGSGLRVLITWPSDAVYGSVSNAPGP